MTGPSVDAATVARWLRGFAAAVARERDALTELDSAIGDADHGLNLDRGMSAVLAQIDRDGSGTPSQVLKRAGMTLVSTVGGASGPLYGTLLMRMASAWGDSEALSGNGFAVGLRAGLDGVAARGRAQPGDKTMLDALSPACDRLDAELAEEASLPRALAGAAAAAEAGRDATVPMVAHKGRASYLGERSAGHQDPGATSMALLIRAAAEALRDPAGG